MTDREDIDMLAAEYVLGTLDRDERSSVAERRLLEPELDAAIGAWEQRLGSLNEHVADMSPGAEVYDTIRRRITARSVASPPVTKISAEIVQLRNRVSRWRSAAIAASAVAATFAGIFAYNAELLIPPRKHFVAVFNQGDQQPQFILTIDLNRRELTIRPITATAQSGKSYELWIVSDKIQLRSLGLLDVSSSLTRKQLGAFEPELLRQATFGISLEPQGGSPVGKPTGPALHGKLIPSDT